MAKKYHPWNFKPQSWDSIENRFSEDFGGKNLKMIELVKHIRQIGLSERIYGATSLLDTDKLILSIYEPIDSRKEALRITFNLISKMWSFNYFALPFQEPEFVRTYSADKGIEKFDQFINFIKW